MKSVAHTPEAISRSGVLQLGHSVSIAKVLRVWGPSRQKIRYRTFCRCVSVKEKRRLKRLCAE